eukprot:415010-Rhodomonas_salina.2
MSQVMCSRAYYAVSGTDLSRGVLCLRVCYAMSGTDIAVHCHAHGPSTQIPTEIERAEQQSAGSQTAETSRAGLTPRGQNTKLVFHEHLMCYALRLSCYELLSQHLPRCPSLANPYCSPFRPPSSQPLKEVSDLVAAYRPVPHTGFVQLRSS